MTAKQAIRAVFLIMLLASVAAAATIPAGTRIPVRISQELSSGTAQAGQTFEGVVARDVAGTSIKAGTPVTGKVVSAKSSGRIHAPGILRIRLASVGGQPVRTATVARQGKSHTKSNATKIGGGAVAGTVIGAIAGGGKGAAIGALAGGAAGTGVAAATGKQEAVIPAEATLTFTVSGATSPRAQ